MSKLKKVLLMCTAYVLVAALAIGGTIAYLQDSDSDVNVMTLGNVKIEQHEYERVVNEDGTYKTDTIDNEHFFVRKNGLLYATPLMLVLILVELSDVIFAVDSIPAIFAVTTDPFIVLTSNLFAILGLRAMYFLLAGVAERFSMLKYGLAVILVFIGIKMLIVDFYHIPIAVSLGVVFGILVMTFIINAWVNYRHDK